MKAKYINRGLTQYRELYKIDDYDEFIHCIVYEFAIRDIKNELMEMFKVFAIENDEIVLVEEEINKQIIGKERDDELYKEAKALAEDGNYLKEIYYYWILVIEDKLFFRLGITLVDLYIIEYSFFTDEFKKVFIKIFNSVQLYDEKVIFNNIKVSTYHNSKFSRVTKSYPQMKNSNFRKIGTHYRLNYRRPILFPDILSDNKNADITINTDLPKEVILKQVEKLIDIMRADDKHIVSNHEMNLLADNKEHEKIKKEIFDNKENFIDKFIIYDFMELRSKEIKKENEEIKIKKDKLINEVKKLESLNKREKLERIRNINQAHKKITRVEIKNEIAEILKLSSFTVEKYLKDCNRLFKDRNYLSLVHGKIIG